MPDDPSAPANGPRDDEQANPQEYRVHHQEIAALESAADKIRTSASHLRLSSKDLKDGWERKFAAIDAELAELHESVRRATGSLSTAAERKAFEEFLRYNRDPGELLQRVDVFGVPKEGKLLSIGDESLGGVLSPPDFGADIIRGAVEISPIRALATVLQTSRSSRRIGKRTGSITAEWVTERGTRTAMTGLTFGRAEIPTHEQYVRVEISNEDLEDPIVNLDGEIVTAASEQFGALEATGFVSGSGVGQPEGLLTNADVRSSATHNGGASFTNADGIFALTTAIKSNYLPRAVFLLNRATLETVKTLKASRTGNYLYNVTPNGETLAGYPIVLCPDMPDVASGSLPILFGSVNAAYVVLDRLQVATLRDPFTEASSGLTVIHLRRRVGGQVVLPEAVNALVMEA